MSRNDRFLPCPEIAAILEPAFQPCCHFSGRCAGIARWDPARGHVPRGFTGAFGTLDDIELILVVAEPGDPLDGETHEMSGSAVDLMARVSRYVFSQFEAQRTQFHRNLRRILDGCWPGVPLRTQLERTWITESYLCSAPRESGPVPAVSVTVCSRDYLSPQLALLADRAVVACGRKAEKRLRGAGAGKFLPVGAVAPPGGNLPQVRASWLDIPTYVAECRSVRRAVAEDKRPAVPRANGTTGQSPSPGPVGRQEMSGDRTIEIRVRLVTNPPDPNPEGMPTVEEAPRHAQDGVGTIYLPVNDLHGIHGQPTLRFNSWDELVPKAKEALEKAGVVLHDSGRRRGA